MRWNASCASTSTFCCWKRVNAQGTEVPTDVVTAASVYQNPTIRKGTLKCSVDRKIFIWTSQSSKCSMSSVLQIAFVYVHYVLAYRLMFPIKTQRFLLLCSTEMEKSTDNDKYLRVEMSLPIWSWLSIGENDQNHSRRHRSIIIFNRQTFLFTNATQSMKPLLCPGSIPKSGSFTCLSYSSSPITILPTQILQHDPISWRRRTRMEISERFVAPFF